MTLVENFVKAVGGRVRKFNSPLAKENPNHGPDGKFSSGPSGGNAKVTSEQHSWGKLTHVKFGPDGIAGQAVLHPEHVEQIKASGDSPTYFKDEQGINWKVTPHEQGGEKMLHFDSGSRGLQGSVPQAHVLGE